MKALEKNLDKIRGALTGGAIGDALGYSVEFLTLDRITGKYGEQGITAYAFDRTSGKALISDDTQMTLFNANGILFGETRGRMRGIGAAPHDYVAMAYQDWLTTQYADYRTGSRTKRYDCGRGVSWLLDVPELYSRRAPGNTCISALSEVYESRNVSDYIKCPRNNSKGCGGIMRVAPLGIHDANTPIEWLNQEGAYLSAITHGHPLGYLPAAVLPMFIRSRRNVLLRRQRAISRKNRSDDWHQRSMLRRGDRADRHYASRSGRGTCCVF